VVNIKKRNGVKKVSGNMKIGPGEVKKWAREVEKWVWGSQKSV